MVDPVALDRWLLSLAKDAPMTPVESALSRLIRDNTTLRPLVTKLSMNSGRVEFTDGGTEMAKRVEAETAAPPKKLDIATIDACIAAVKDRAGAINAAEEAGKAKAVAVLEGLRG